MASKFKLGKPNLKKNDLIITELFRLDFLLDYRVLFVSMVTMEKSNEALSSLWNWRLIQLLFMVKRTGLCAIVNYHFFISPCGASTLSVIKCRNLLFDCTRGWRPSDIFLSNEPCSQQSQWTNVGTGQFSKTLSILQIPCRISIDQAKKIFFQLELHRKQQKMCLKSYKRINLHNCKKNHIKTGQTHAKTVWTVYRYIFIYSYTITT
jgi:hypothetical protein